MKSSCLRFGAVSLFFVTSTLVHAAEGRPEPEVLVDAVPRVNAWPAGETVDVALQLEITHEAHIYWRNRGEGGLEPSFDWQLPSGWEVGEVRYPWPTREVDVIDAHTFILEGEPILVVPIKVPEDAEVGSSATIGCKIKWLICRELCWPRTSEIAVTQPIVAADGEVKREHEAVFQAAEAKFPKSAQDVPYLKSLKTVSNVSKVAPGAEFEIGVLFEMVSSHAVFSHQPISPRVVPLDLFPYAAENVFIERPRFEKGVSAQSGSQPVRVLRDRIFVRLPIKADNEIASDSLQLSGIVRFQAAEGSDVTPMPAESVEWSITLPVASDKADVERTHSAVFEHPTPLEASEPPQSDTADQQPEEQQPEQAKLVEATIPTKSSGREFTWPGGSSGQSNPQLQGPAQSVAPPTTQPVADQGTDGDQPQTSDGLDASLPRWTDQPRSLDKLTITSSQAEVSPGESFELKVDIDVADDYHIYANKPGDPNLKPLLVRIKANPNLEVGDVDYPAGELKPSPIGPGFLASHSSKVTLSVPLRVAANVQTASLEIEGEVRYQGCNDITGTCDPPQKVEWALTIPVDTEGAIPTGPSDGSDAGGEKSAQDGAADDTPPDTLASESWIGRLQQWLLGLGFWGYLIAAALGGFILNLMPCVLPVISIKVLSFVQQSKEDRVRVLTLGLAFSAGIVVSFLALGILIIGMGQVWGGLFQKPRAVIALCAIVTAFGLSLFGVFTLKPPRAVEEIGGQVKTEGHGGAFAMGLLATVLGTACTAPLLAGVIAVAVKLPPMQGMAVFLVAGLGMAFPYVLLAAKPVWVKVIPKPGPWMVTFEHIMGFLLLLTVVWLLNTVQSQLGGPGLLLTILFLVLISIAVWLYGKVTYNTPPRRKTTYRVGAAVIAIGAWVLCFHILASINGLIARQMAREEAVALAKVGVTPAEKIDPMVWVNAVDWDQEEFPWLPYTRARARAVVEAGYPVFIDYTATWCMTCRSNKVTVLETDRVRQAMQQLGIIPFKADYTIEKPEIREDLEKYGSANVPMYLVFPAGKPDDANKLDEILTSPASFIASLERIIGKKLPADSTRAPSTTSSE